jgi:transcription initiation factor IIE alpha subunit
MIAPMPSKFVCSKCGYSKIHVPKSDAMMPTDFMQTCPKCGGDMKSKELDKGIDMLIGKFKSLLRF